LPKEAVDAPSLEAFKASLVGDPAHSRGLELDEHCGPLQPRPFCDAMIFPGDFTTPHPGSLCFTSSWGWVPPH